MPATSARFQANDPEMMSSSITLVLAAFATALLLGGCAASGQHAPPPSANAMPDRAAIGALLDKLHTSAASANADAYWACYTDNAVFIGTDATERWTLTEFKEYAEPHFATGKGWSYTPSNRHIDFSPDRRTAWFDETVTHAQYGACRGTGVVLLTPSGWKVAQYHLTLPIPNDLLPEEAEKIKKYLAEPRKDE